MSAATALSASTEKRSWSVLLLGGPSGVGKTSVSYRLARRYDVGLTELDDLHIALKCLTTPEQQPVLHEWDMNPRAIDWSAEKILELHISVCRVMAPAIAAVIANHVETRTPIVLEGDYLLPEMAAASGDAMAAVFLYEPDEAQIVHNFVAREPEGGDPAKRARVTWLFGQWLREECRRYGAVALPSRPWSSVLERIADVIG